MPKVTHAAKVGLFLVVCAVAFAIVLKTIDKGGSVTGAYVLHAYLKDATGLAVHSRVTIAGIPVGTIDSIRLESGKARFDLRMNKDVSLYDNATIGKKSALVLGEAVLVLTAGTEDRRKLKDGDEITHVIEFTETGDVLDEVKQIADKVRLVAEQLANAIGSEQGGKNMEAILQNLANATEAMNSTIRENREYLKDTLRNVDPDHDERRAPRWRRSSPTCDKSPTTCARSWRCRGRGRRRGTSARRRRTCARRPRRCRTCCRTPTPSRRASTAARGRSGG